MAVAVHLAVSTKTGMLMADKPGLLLLTTWAGTSWGIREARRANNAVGIRKSWVSLHVNHTTGQMANWAGGNTIRNLSQ